MSECYGFDASSYLEHYGVKGMKWGIRRSPRRPGRREDRKRVKEMKKNVKLRRLLSDQDLSYAISRLEKEKRLRELTKDEIGYGKNITSNILRDVGTRTAKTIATGAAIYAVKYAVTKKFDPVDFAGYIAPKPKNK